jgi:hypothetical protein
MIRTPLNEKNPAVSGKILHSEAGALHAPPDIKDFAGISVPLLKNLFSAALYNRLTQIARAFSVNTAVCGFF